MNVVKIQRIYRRRGSPVERAIDRPPTHNYGCEDQWHSLLEVLLFGLMAIASAWPLFDAGAAVFRCL